MILIISLQLDQVDEVNLRVCSECSVRGANYSAEKFDGSTRFLTANLMNELSGGVE